MSNAPTTPIPHAPKKHPLQDDFYARHNVTTRDARNLCSVLGLKPSRHLMFAANLLVTMKMKR